MTPMNNKIKVFGNVGSPYTQKILALLRYRNIPYSISWGDVVHNLSLLGVEAPKPVLLPTLIFKDKENKKICKTDTTPIIRYLEELYDKKSVIPSSPVLSFLNYLLEDFADEWTTKFMFHYRWHFDEDAQNAKKMLVLQHKLNIDNDSLKQFGDVIAERQINRLWVVGSNEDTAQLIDDSYKRYLSLMESHFTNQPFMFGDRPSSSDFGLYGQLTQLVSFDPTPSNIAYKNAPRTISWVNIMSDLSGLHNNGGVGEFFGIENNNTETKLDYFEDNNSGWVNQESLPDTLKNIFEEIGKVYIPCLLANSAAFDKGEKKWQTIINGSTWSQKTFPYQVKCLKWIKEEFKKLDKKDQNKVKEFLKDTGCNIILS